MFRTDRSYCDGWAVVNFYGDRIQMNATTIYENGATGELSGIHLGFKGRDSGIIRATRNASITIDPDTKLPCGSIQDYLQESGGRINNKARSY